MNKRILIGIVLNAIGVALTMHFNSVILTSAGFGLCVAGVYNLIKGAEEK
jgi:hypothetical protein